MDDYIIKFTNKDFKVTEVSFIPDFVQPTK
jgi:hypothetical protein